MRIILSVTNDLTYDQRMQRICGTLAANGHAVTLVGRTLPGSVMLEAMPFKQKRLSCFFRKGPLFYAEYNWKLFWWLLFASFDAVCSVDLDTLPAGCLASLIRRKKRVFDAHEYFTEVPEVVDRPVVRWFWEQIARVCLPFYRHAYTVGPALAMLFEAKYKLPFGVVRNVPIQLLASNPLPQKEDKVILYQGALNEGRGIEAMLEAMQYLDNVQLVLAGEGDLSEQLRQSAIELGLSDKVFFLGYIKPVELKTHTAQAWLGLNLLENRGLSYYYSLANKFFDCVQASVPVLTMNFPEYRALNATHEVAILLDNLSPHTIASAVQKLLMDAAAYEKLRQNCLLARDSWNWGLEEKKLLEIWHQVEMGP